MRIIDRSEKYANAEITAPKWMHRMPKKPGCALSSRNNNMLAWIVRKRRENQKAEGQRAKQNERKNGVCEDRYVASALGSA